MRTPATMQNNPPISRRIITSTAVLFAITLLCIGSKLLSPKTTQPASAIPANTASVNQADAGPTNGTYKSGSYSAVGAYKSPGGKETIRVNLQLNGNTVSQADVQSLATDGVAQLYQADFISGYKQYVVGKDINSLHVSRVSGSSLTSAGFNDALKQIKQQAKS